MDGPKLIKRNESWMLVCPSDQLMIVSDGADQLITDQAFIVMRKVK